LEIREQDGGVTLRVRVQPRASHDALGGERAGALVVRLTAAPVEGAANVSLVRLIGKTLGLAPSSVEIVRGAGVRDKLLRIVGRSAAEVRALLERA
jgi:hypothetical protein